MSGNLVGSTQKPRTSMKVGALKGSTQSVNLDQGDRKAIHTSVSNLVETKAAVKPWTPSDGVSTARLDRIHLAANMIYSTASLIVGLASPPAGVALLIAELVLEPQKIGEPYNELAQAAESMVSSVMCGQAEVACHITKQIVTLYQIANSHEKPQSYPPAAGSLTPSHTAARGWPGGSRQPDFSPTFSGHPSTSRSASSNSGGSSFRGGNDSQDRGSGVDSNSTAATTFEFKGTRCTPDSCTSLD